MITIAYSESLFAFALTNMNLSSPPFHMPTTNVTHTLRSTQIHEKTSPLAHRDSKREKIIEEGNPFELFPPEHLHYHPLIHLGLNPETDDHLFHSFKNHFYRKQTEPSQPLTENSSTAESWW
jgi:hypothetical protein